jgi:hypothetical protein
MQSTTYKKTTREKVKKADRELVLAISMFLLGREEMRKLFWTVKSVQYDRSKQQVNIGISTITGRLGTTLSHLRKTCRDLSDYLHDQGLTFRTVKINFFIDKQDEELERVNTLLSTIERIERDLEKRTEESQ